MTKEDIMFTLLIVACVGMFVLVGVGMFFAWEDFMMECQQYYKAFECSAIYKSGKVPS